MVVDYRGRRCTCGNIGCVEAMASSFFLPEIIRTHSKISNEYKAKASSYDFKTLFGLMRQGELEATLLCQDCMDVWAAAIINYIHAYDPEIIVIGGGIMRSADIILPYLKERIDRLVWSPENEVEIRASLLGDNAALLGISCTLSTIKKEKML
ncbi:ROK family protein [Bacteroides salyersiae]|nr:ROK family protein [Bacteroides salyersiae]